MRNVTRDIYNFVYFLINKVDKMYVVKNLMPCTIWLNV